MSVPIQAHLMLTGPVAAWMVGIGHVKSWRDGPFTLLVHKKSNVLDVIVLVSGNDCEISPEKLLFKHGGTVRQWQVIQPGLIKSP